MTTLRELASAEELQAARSASISFWVLSGQQFGGSKYRLSIFVRPATSPHSCPRYNQSCRSPIRKSSCSTFAAGRWGMMPPRNPFSTRERGAVTLREGASTPPGGWNFREIGVKASQIVGQVVVRKITMGDIAVLTSITGGKDHLREDQCTDGAKFIAYVSVQRGSEVWEERHAYNRFQSDRRNSRVPKILSHEFCEAEYSIWIDGNLALRVDPGRLVETYLGSCDFAIFRHPFRNCLYDEAETCSRDGLDDPDVISRQVSKYAAAGYAKNLGLAEANVIIRRHSDEVIHFNKTWWAEYCLHSVRDQISFMYAASKAGLRINWMSPTVFTGHEYFHGVEHLTAQPEPAR